MTLMNRLRNLEQQNSFFGRTWYVDAKVGSDSSNGRSAQSPFLTMSKAFLNVDSGDRILFRGKIREQLTTPVGVFDVSIIGAANRPRHADDHSESSTPGRGSSSACWVAPASPTAVTPLLKVIQQGWKVENFLMQAHTDGACILLYRDAGASDDERDASHFHAKTMRFDAGQDHIEQSGGVAFIRIEDSGFRGATAKAMKHTAGAGVGTLLGWNIIDNRFHDNDSHIVLPLSNATIKRNTFGKFTTASLDLRNGVGYNCVSENALSGTYSNAGKYWAAAATDEWGGNWNVISGGVTAADPA